MAFNIARIQVDYTPGLVGLDITDPEVGVQPTKDSVIVNQSHDSLEISAEAAELETTSYPSRADMGLLTIIDRGDATASESQQAALEAIAKYANEGDQLANFQQFDIADLARQNSRRGDQQIEIAYKRRPEHTYIPEQLEINHQEGPLEITSERAGQANRIGVQPQLGDVQSYLSQHPDVEITAPGVRMNVLG